MQVEPLPLKLIAPKVAGGFPIARSLERLWTGAIPAAAADAQYVPSISGLHGGGGKDGGDGDTPGSCIGPEAGATGGGGTADGPKTNCELAAGATPPARGLSMQTPPTPVTD
jgi:hypothetical protein